MMVVPLIAVGEIRQTKFIQTVQRNLLFERSFETKHGWREAIYCIHKSRPVVWAAGLEKFVGRHPLP